MIATPPQLPTAASRS